MQSLALVVHVLLAFVLIGLVLMQHGKGADAGAAFGSGASATVFGARGATSFLTRMTTIIAGLFFITSLLLFWIAANREGVARSVTDSPALVEEIEAPAPAPETDLPAAPAADVPAAGEALPVSPATGGASVDVPVPEVAPSVAPAVATEPAPAD